MTRSQTNSEFERASGWLFDVHQLIRKHLLDGFSRYNLPAATHSSSKATPKTIEPVADPSPASEKSILDDGT